MFRWHVRVVEEKTTHERTNLDVQALSHDTQPPPLRPSPKEKVCATRATGVPQAVLQWATFPGSPDPLEVETSSPHISCINLKPAAAVNPIMASHSTRLITRCNLSLALKAAFTTAQNRACEQMFRRTESEHLSCWKRDSAIGSPAALGSAPIGPSRSAGTAHPHGPALAVGAAQHQAQPGIANASPAGFPPTGSKQPGWGQREGPAVCTKGSFALKADKALDHTRPRTHVNHACTRDAARSLATHSEAEQVREVPGVPEGKP